MFFLKRGANYTDNGSLQFSVWAPNASKVEVVSAANKSEAVVSLETDENGIFSGELMQAPAVFDYYYRLNSELLRSDPVSRFMPEGVFGPSRAVNPAGYKWSDSDWSGVDKNKLVLYELHVGTFTEEGSFDAVVSQFSRLKELGVTAIQLMPVAQFPGERNWGYDGINIYAVQNSYGGPESLRHLVDQAHQHGLAVLLDVVYNHIGPEGNFLADFGPYFTDRHHTPWGQAINFDDAESDEVRRYFIENALYWLREYHLDGLRLDAVHAIYDFGALHFLDELQQAVQQEATQLGRKFHLIAESDLNDPRILRSRAKGGYALDAQWNDDFHHSVIANLTDRHSGYFQDYCSAQAIAKVMTENYAVAGDYSAYRRRRHGASALDLSPDNFIAFIQNHDQVGNPAQGERLSKAVCLEKQQLAASLLLLSPFIPMLFMGEEYGEDNPFFYFVDHQDPKLLKAVSEGRKREFEGFAWGGEMADPALEETYKRSKVNTRKRLRSPHSNILTLYTDLLKLRREHPCFSAPERRMELVSLKDRALHLRLSSVSSSLQMAFNLSGEPQVIQLGTGCELIFSTTDEKYQPEHTETQLIRTALRSEGNLELPAFAAACVRESA